ncbi:MscS family membrane protein [Bathymodiolus japonicus methanotrophic gill symbiont]|uniref:mechanosensitive ion channel family protein n=1 Tax=Bathymodiolus japonicus methanotrophic gill symbiont TaxID=113269 RepID=UPI001B680390|nr:mechanosensitive ion channel family protein [Bathymodiolus japonicus methanotrophic gill symbiont]GFO72631.1 MscS family membrane protein [Bathymodiolus japonicus methanotrophic gill symbiont]
MVNKFIKIILLMFLFVTSFQIKADSDGKYIAITGMLKSVSDVNQQISENDNDAKLQILLQEKQTLLRNLLQIIRGSFIDYDVQDIDEEKLKLLRSKIRINRSRGNTVAVQRDKYDADYIMTKRDIGAYVVYLVEASRNYKTKEEIIAETKQRLQLLKKKVKATPEPIDGDGEIYQDLAKNHKDLLRIYAVYQDLLEYILANPEAIATTSFFQKMSLVSFISYINSHALFKDINFKIAPLRIDMGGIIVSLCIMLLNVIAFPLVSRASNRLVERFILDDGKIENVELVFISMHKPILYLMLFFGIDLALNALLYKTEIKITIDYFIYIIYAGLYIFLLFNIINSVVAVHAEQAERRNKAYSKELVLLLVKGLKGLVFLIVLTFLLSHFGINITAILSTLGIGGLAFAMAAKDSLSNFFGGLNIMIDRIFKMGDWIKVGSVEGTVVEIGLRSTTVRTFDNALITMPNSLVSTASVLNWNRRSVGRRIKMHIGVTYESNMDDIRQALLDIKSMLEDHSGIASPKEKHTSIKAKNKFLTLEDVHGIKSTQLVFLDRYNEFSIDILIYCFSKTVNWPSWLEVKQDVMFKIAEILKKNNLSFAYPTNVQINRNEESVLAE